MKETRYFKHAFYALVDQYSDIAHFMDVHALLIESFPVVSEHWHVRSKYPDYILRRSIYNNNNMYVKRSCT